MEEGEEGGEVRERDGRAGRFLDDRGDGVATTPAPSSYSGQKVERETSSLGHFKVYSF